MHPRPFHELYVAAVERLPDKLAIVCDDRRLTYREYDRMVRSFTRALRYAGIEPGDRVGISMFGCPELAALYLACLRLGAVAVPVADFAPDGLVRVANFCEVRLYLTDASFFTALTGKENEIPSLRRPLLSVESEAWASLLEQAERAGVSDAPAEYAPHAPAIIWCTSGSTGEPKGVTYSQHALQRQLENRQATLQHTESDIAMTVLRLTHCAAPTGTLFTMLAVGGTGIFVSRFEPTRCFSLITQYRPTHFTSVPYAVKALLQDPGLAKTDFSCFRFFSAGGDQVTAELQREFRMATGLPLIPILGMTECSGYVTTVPPLPVKEGKLGKPFHGTEVTLLTETGEVAQRGEIGELRIRTDGRMLGYWQAPELTAEVIRDGWMHTGDLAVEDEDGYFEFCGRSKNIIIRMGSNVMPGEVERALSQHPQVKETGVVGIADALVGQRVAALVVAEPSSDAGALTAEALREFCVGRLANHKIPERIFFVDKLPRNALGKLQRKELAEIAATR